MNKRGEVEHPFFFPMEVILGLLVAGILIVSVTNLDSISNVNKIYAQQDLKLLTETIQASPSNIKYDYKLKNMYEVNIQNKEIIITRTNSFLEGYSYYNLTLTKNKDDEQILVEKNA